jgi:hypothetical protein
MDKINSEFHEEYIKYRTAFPKGYIAPKQESVHWSDCAVHNGPAYPAGECNCGAAQEPVADRLERLLWEYIDLQAAHPEHRPDLKTWPHLMIYAPQPAQEPVARVLQIIKELRPAIKPMEGMGKGKTTEEWFDILVKEIERIQPAQQEAIYGMNQDDWKDIVAAITKVRDGRGIYLGCRPADVFQDWFLALGTAKVKEKNNA